MERHLDTHGRRFRTGMLNIRSVCKKVDNVVDLIAEYRLDLLILGETWHEDEDSAAIKRLRGHGLNVIEAARRIPKDANTADINFINHGGHTRAPKPKLAFSAEDFHDYIDDKINTIWEKTSAAGPATYGSNQGPLFEGFSAPTCAEVEACVRAAPNKQCHSDPLPTWLLKESIGTLAPYLTSLMTASPTSGVFPSSWKSAIVSPRPKRTGLDPATVASYRPISNLPFLSKILERLANKQLVMFLTVNGLMPKDQSAYRRGHSTETAVLKIYSDLVDGIFNDRVGLLCLLWHKGNCSFLAERLPYEQNTTVHCNGFFSKMRPVLCGVPQGSVLDPLLFVLYLADVHKLISSSGLHAHGYADDVQVYATCTPSESDELRKQVECLQAVELWMATNRLALNPAKTEFLWLSTPGQICLINRAAFTLGNSDIDPVRDVRLLGVTLDETLLFSEHIANVTRSCYHQLRVIKAMRRYLTVSATILMVRALVLSRIDYCNSVLLGLPANLLDKLQSVLNVSARLIFGA